MAKRQKDKRTNNYLQNITQKTKDRATRTPKKPSVNSDAPEGQAVPAPLVTHPVVSHEWGNDREQTKQWPNEKRTKGHTTISVQNTMDKAKDRATRTPLKTEREPRCSERESSSTSTCYTPRDKS